MQQRMLLRRLCPSLLFVLFLITGCAGQAGSAQTGATATTANQQGDASAHTLTPIKHVIIILGENHTFDNVFGAYQPTAGQTVKNLLSEGIITASGGLGPNADLARQLQASNTDTYTLDPKKTGAYTTLPRPDTTYAVGLPQTVPDKRFPTNLPNGPFQITKYVPYTAYLGDPLHRFYQMWQQQDEGKGDLYTWVANSAGDDNGAHPPQAIHQGAVSMGYYNMSAGDAPVLKFIADHYAMSDNYHQSVMGGTGANHIMIGTGDAAYYTDANGNPAVPPSNQIENPNPKPGTNNNYTQDGYSGGSYTNCSDRSQPGVAAIMDYLQSLPYHTFRDGDCAPGAYYLLNNYSPGYTPGGQLTKSTPFAVPPQTFPTIADELSAHHITWKYYGQGFNHGTDATKEFCGICDPFQYAKSIMTTSLRNNIQDYSQLQKDVDSNTLPAVSFVKPDGINDGHPASSTLSLFEKFSANLINGVMSKPDLFKSTAVVVTMDEGGGYYDSGYIQPVSYFGDGPRIPMEIVSPYVKSGYIDHTYYDHVSLLKFIEKNWYLHPLSQRSLDNLPDPTPSSADPYKPANSPAVGDLMQMFDFTHLRTDTPTVP